MLKQWIHRGTEGPLISMLSSRTVSFLVCRLTQGIVNILDNVVLIILRLHIEETLRVSSLLTKCYRYINTHWMYLLTKTAWWHAPINICTAILSSNDEMHLWCLEDIFRWFSTFPQVHGEKQCHIGYGSSCYLCRTQRTQGSSSSCGTTIPARLTGATFHQYYISRESNAIFFSITSHTSSRTFSKKHILDKAFVIHKFVILIHSAPDQTEPAARHALPMNWTATCWITTGSL